ncbi:MAG: hypothetical protein EBZ40_04640 [Gammaproteobacteria bacterium]|nr:hypothetical protein [Gammaproteobacteria bacterium]
MKGTPLIVIVATLATGGCTSVRLVNPVKQVVPPAAQPAVAVAAAPAVKDPFAWRKPWLRLVPRKDNPSAAKIEPTRDVSNPAPAPVVAPVAAPTDMGEDIVAVGFASIGAQSGKDSAQQRLMAARASKVDAYRNLAEQVYGVTLGSETVLEDHKLQGDAVRTRIAGIVSGAELVSVEPLGSDTYQTTLRLPARQVAQLRQRLQR